MPKQVEKLFELRPRSHGYTLSTWQEILEEDTAQATQPEQPAPALSDKERIDKLLARLAFTTREGEGMSERNAFVTKYHWIPYHEAEVTIATRSLGTHLGIAGKAKQGRTGALIDVLKNVDRYRSESSQALEDLGEAFIDPDEPKKVVLPKPEARLVRNTENVVNALVDFMLAKECLDYYQWYPRAKGGGTTEATTKRLDELKALIPQMTDEEVMTLWQLDYISNKARARYWADQYNSLLAQSDERVLAAQSRL